MKATRFFFLFLAITGGFAPRAAAYRPFESENAEISEKGSTQLEAGARVQNEGRAERVLFPEAEINYGLSETWELGTYRVLQLYEEDEERNVELLGSEATLKTLLRDGVLQDKEGPSLAAEAGVLFPSTEENERSFGLRAAGIVSHEAAGIMNHTNVGIEQDRDDFKSNLVWGTAFEFPAEAKVRLVSELNGKVKYNDRPENSALIGMILETRPVSFDIAARKGLSETSPDWEVLAGVTKEL